MFDQSFQMLSRNELDVQLATLFRRWDASPQQRAEFVSWAWVVASAADITAQESPVAASELLRQNCEQVHTQLAEKLHSCASVDLELVSKRMFLDWLASELVVERIAA